ncbi:spherulation-specific family 4 protein [Tautonia sp. JC769]|uniref:spherulation-specific family 4 protein n=1 Tax=Tautonia sp. JC769 TaxID=3232135 RepID=UPI00345A6102
MTCTCKSEFWVRDRLSGTATPCPSCGVALEVPSIEAVRTSMSPAACSCGEVFWSSAWQPGKLSRCPVCGDVVGPGRTEEETTVIIPPGPADVPGPALRTQGEPGQPAYPPTPTAPRADAARRSPATTEVEPTVDRPSARRRAIAVAAGAALLLAAGLFLGSRLPGSPGGDPDPPSAPPASSGGGGDTSPGGDVVTPRPPTDRGPSALKILVPAYFYPGGSGLDDWKRLIASAARAPIVAVVNPASGPGDAPNQDYANVIRGGAAIPGLTMIGYVNTEFGARPRPAIEADIDRWARFYPEIRGIFLDAQSVDAEDVGLYVELHDSARNAIGDALVVTNPGIICAEDYFERGATDLAVVFENSRGFDEFDMPLWRLRYRPERFAALPHGVASADAMEAAVRQAGAKGIGSIFVTDGTMPNPWGGLPPYWDEMVRVVGEMNSALPTEGL